MLQILSIIRPQSIASKAGLVERASAWRAASCPAGRLMDAARIAVVFPAA